MNYIDTDVIIVGAGPAGCAAAIQGALAGLNTMLVEGQSFPRERPGETLHPGVEPLLRQLGVAERISSAGFLRHNGNWVQWEGERRFMPFGSDDAGPWRGFQAWRSEFDVLLLNRARELGAEVLQPCRALRPIMDGNRVAGVMTSKGPFRSSFVIDTAGSKHWFAKQLGLNIKQYSPRLLVSYGYVAGECPIRDDAPAIVADKRGWTWTTRVRPQLYQWTRLSFGPEPSDSNRVPNEFQGLTPKGRTRRADVTWRMVPGAAGPGYFLVGDAAAVLDPASSHGVLKAIMSGMLVGHLIAQIVHHGHDDHTVTQAYCRWLSNWFKHDLERMKKIYETHPIPPHWIREVCMADGAIVPKAIGRNPSKTIAALAERIADLI